MVENDEWTSTLNPYYHTLRKKMSHLKLYQVVSEKNEQLKDAT